MSQKGGKRSEASDNTEEKVDRSVVSEKEAMQVFFFLITRLLGTR